MGRSVENAEGQRCPFCMGREGVRVWTFPPDHPKLMLCISCAYSYTNDEGKKAILKMLKEEFENELGR